MENNIIKKAKEIVSNPEITLDKKQISELLAHLVNNYKKAEKIQNALVNMEDLLTKQNLKAYFEKFPESEPTFDSLISKKIDLDQNIQKKEQDKKIKKIELQKEEAPVIKELQEKISSFDKKIAKLEKEEYEEIKKIKKIYAIKTKEIELEKSNSDIPELKEKLEEIRTSDKLGKISEEIYELEYELTSVKDEIEKHIQNSKNISFTTTDLEKDIFKANDILKKIASNSSDIESALIKQVSKIEDSLRMTNFDVPGNTEEIQDIFPSLKVEM